MSSRYAQQGKYLVVALVLIGLLISLAATTAEADPFSSPQSDNKIHQPFVTNNSGESVPQPAKVESQGIPLIWIILLLVLLFIPAAALITSRRR
jgi:beta-lactamase regulating signal transducer with metallopeptidase domain